MPNRRTTIEQATPDELRSYATHFLQLALPANAPPAKVLSLINSAQPGDNTVWVNDAESLETVIADETIQAPPLREEEAKGRQSGTLGKSDPRAVILIPVVETSDESGTRDVYVGVNGRAWQLKRGAELDVPWRVVVALRNAVSTIVTHSMEAETLGEVISRDASRVGFQILEGPTKAEIAEWEERTAAEFCA